MRTQKFNLSLRIIILLIFLFTQTVCEEGCQIGPNGMCKTCTSDNKSCASCNFGYYLENGHCEFLSSFNAIYETTNEDEFVNFFGDLDKRYAKISIISVEIDGELMTSQNLYYKFPSIGKHSVKALLSIDGNNLINLFMWNQKLISIKFTPYFNTNNIINMGGLFSQCNKLEYVDMSNFDTSLVTHMASMFDGCNSLKSIDLSNFDTHNVVLMESMFSGCKSLTSIDLSNFITDNVKYMYGMFLNCESLKSIDISNFNTPKLRDMSYMFKNCKSLTSIDLSSFNTSQVYDGGYYDESDTFNRMFFGCTSLTYIDISSFESKDKNFDIFQDESSYGILKIKREFYKKLKYVPEGWKIIFID